MLKGLQTGDQYLFHIFGVFPIFTVSADCFFFSRGCEFIYSLLFDSISCALVILICFKSLVPVAAAMLFNAVLGGFYLQ